MPPPGRQPRAFGLLASRPLSWQSQVLAASWARPVAAVGAPTGRGSGAPHPTGSKATRGLKGKQECLEFRLEKAQQLPAQQLPNRQDELLGRSIRCAPQYLFKGRTAAKAEL